MDYFGVHTQRPLRIVAEIDDDDQTVMVKLEHLDTALLERFILNVLAPEHRVYAFTDETSISNPILNVPNRYSLTILIAEVSYVAYVCKLFRRQLLYPSTTFVLRPKVV